MTTLLTDILAFCTEHGLTEGQFGVMAANDKNLIRDLRGDGGKRPRRMWPESEAKVRAAMSSYRADKAA